MTEGWMIGASSVIGPAHIRRGLPNQDAAVVRPSGDKPTPVIFGALSDGHGASPHFRSDRGSRIAVESAIELLQWTAESSEDIDIDSLAQTVVESWRKRVDDDVAQDPYEQGVAEHYSPYGATMLGLMADDRQVCLMQLGDGDILLGFPDGRIERPIAPDTGLWGEQTYSLCLPNAENHLHGWVAHRDWDDELPDFILAGSDGVSKSLVSEDAFHDVAAQYRERCRSGAEVFSQTMSALPQWLENLAANGSGDDASMILAVKLKPNGTMR